MTGAAEALVAAAVTRVAAIGAMTGIYPAAPLQASSPYAVVETTLETDWSHKTGQGREVRLSILLHDKGERQDRLRALMAEAETRMAGLDPEMGSWRVVNLVYLRSRIVGGPREGWTGMIDYRARMLGQPAV